MNRILASAATLVALIGAAYAAETEGTVQAVDPESRTIVLDNGTALKAGDEVALETIATGAKVKVTYDEETSTVTAIEPM